MQKDLSLKWIDIKSYLDHHSANERQLISGNDKLYHFILHGGEYPENHGMPLPPKPKNWGGWGDDASWDMGPGNNDWGNSAAVVVHQNNS